MTSTPDHDSLRAPRIAVFAWAAGLFVVALALRLLHLVTIRDSPFFSILYIDPLFFDEWGRRRRPKSMVQFLLIPVNKALTLGV